MVIAAGSFRGGHLVREEPAPTPGRASTARTIKTPATSSRWF